MNYVLSKVWWNAVRTNFLSSPSADGPTTLRPLSDSWHNSLLDQRLEVHVELLHEPFSDVEDHAVDVGAALLRVRLLQHRGVVQLRGERERGDKR